MHGIDPNLVILNISFTAALVAMFVVTVIVLWKQPQKNLSRSFAVMSLASIITVSAYIVGVNTVDVAIAHYSFLLMLASLFAATATIHWMFASLDILEERWRTVTLLYSIGCVLMLFYFVFPEMFVSVSTSLLYFNLYFLPGPFHFLYVLFFVGIFSYAVIVFRNTYMHADLVVKNRIRYYVLSLLLCYGFAGLMFVPAYGVLVNPLLAVLGVLTVIPMAYTVLKKDILDIREASKLTLFYGLMIGLMMSLIQMSTILTTALSDIIPNFPQFFVPFVASLMVVSVGAKLWQRVRDVETLKYEFISIVTHKFRTPLTHVKWAIEALHQPIDAAERERLLHEILNANTRLVDLTDILVGLVRVEASDYLYHQEIVDLPTIMQRVIEGARLRADEKHIRLSLAVETGVPPVSVDVKRIQFALQIIIENAISYTPKNGSVAVTIGWHRGSVTMAVHDTGIGISRSELPHIFAKFYRGSEAKMKDSEGMGIGLYMAKSIIVRHGGKITADSAGQGQGTTFYIRLPGSAT